MGTWTFNNRTLGQHLAELTDVELSRRVAGWRVIVLRRYLVNHDVDKEVVDRACRLAAINNKQSVVVPR